MCTGWSNVFYFRYDPRTGQVTPYNYQAAPPNPSANLGPPNQPPAYQSSPNKYDPPPGPPLNPPPYPPAPPYQPAKVPDPLWVLRILFFCSLCRKSIFTYPMQYIHKRNICLPSRSNNSFTWERPSKRNQSMKWDYSSFADWFYQFDLNTFKMLSKTIWNTSNYHLNSTWNKLFDL